MRQHLDIKHEGTMGDDDRTRMRLDENATAHLMSILTDLYSDPELAVIREYATNAWDSHRAAGNDAPIEIELPSPLRPVYVVRDFGTGMSVDEIQDHFAKYGWSSKRDTDTEVGMLGLGCKSALTYTSQFTLISTKNGIKATVLVTRDKDGCGVVQIMDTAATEEPNGVTIEIPVNNYSGFNIKAREFFWFWEPGSVLVNGLPLFDPNNTVFKETDGMRRAPGDDPDQDFQIDPDVVLTTRLRRHYIVMGNVPYPVDDYEFDVMKGSGSRGVYAVARVPIGTINFTPSREALHMTKRTKETLDALREFVTNTFRRIAQMEVDAAPNETEAIRVCQRWADKFSEFQGSVVHTDNGSRVVKVYGLTYRGVPIPRTFNMHHTKPRQQVDADGKPIFNANGTPVMYNPRLEDSKCFAWGWTPNWGSGYGGGAVRTQHLDVTNLLDADLLIAGHKGNGISRLTKQRIDALMRIKFAKELKDGSYFYGSKKVIVFPILPGGGWLNDCPIITFDELKTIDVDGGTKATRPPPMMYRVFNNGGTYLDFDEADTLPKNKIVLWYRASELPAESTVYARLDQALGENSPYVLVRITQRYENKFVEKHPNAVHLDTWLYAMFMRLVGKTTPHVAYTVKFGTFYAGDLSLRWFEGVDDQIEDPELRTLVVMADESKAHDLSHRLDSLWSLGKQRGVWTRFTIDPKTAKRTYTRKVSNDWLEKHDVQPIHDLISRVTDRYPLFKALDERPPYAEQQKVTKSTSRNPVRKGMRYSISKRRYSTKHVNALIEYVNDQYRKWKEKQSPTHGRKGKL